MPHLSRRTLLAAAAALPAASALAEGTGVAAGAPASLTVGAPGEAYNAALAGIVDRPILAPQHVAVRHAPAAVPALVSAVADARREPSGPLDVVCLPDVDMYILSLLQPFRFVTATTLPDLPRVQPSLRAPYAVPQFGSGLVLLYDRRRTKAPPRSWSALWSPEWRGQVGFADSLDYYVMAAATLGAAPEAEQGGRDYSAGLRQLAAAKANGARLYPDAEALGAALRGGEIALCPALRAHGYVWGRSASQVAVAVPGEGAVAYVQMAAVPRNAPAGAEGFLYLEALLRAASQRGFAEQLGGIPTVRGIDLPRGLLGEIGFDAAQQQRLHRPDYNYLSQSGPMLRQRWSALFSG